MCDIEKSGIKNSKEYEEQMPNMLYDLIKDHLPDIPILEWDHKFVGGTDYIDSIREDDMSNTIMCGIDCYKRFFISFRIETTFLDTKQKKKTVQTIFQRYTDQSRPVMVASNSSVLLIPTSLFSYNHEKECLDWGDVRYFDIISSLLENGEYTDKKYNLYHKLY